MPDVAPPADGAALTSSYLQTMMREQVIRTVTSSTRPTGVEGAVIYETDTDRTLYYDGTGWIIMSEPAQTYTPTLTQSGAVTKTVTEAVYQRSAGRCYGNVLLTCTGAGTGTNNVLIGLPIAANHPQSTPIGSGILLDVSSAYWSGALTIATSNVTAGITGYNTLAGWLGLVGTAAALASGDIIGAQFSYQMDTPYL